MFQIHTPEIHFPRLAILCAVLALVGSTLAAGYQDPCASATALDLNATQRGHGAAGEIRVLRLDVPATGIVSVDFSVPGAARSAPRIDFLGDGCSRAVIRPATVILEHSAGRLSFAAREAGVYYLRAGAQDPRRALGDFKIRTAFAEAEAIDQELSIELAGRPVQVLKTDYYAPAQLAKTVEVEIDPDPFLYDAQRDGLLLTHASLVPDAAGKTVEVEIDPDPTRTAPLGTAPDRLDVVILYGAAARLSAKTVEVEIDPDPLTGGAVYARGLDHTVTGLVTFVAGDSGPEKTIEVEIDPDPLVLPADPQDPGQKTVEVEIDPDPLVLPADPQDPGNKTVEVEIDPDPARGPSTGLRTPTRRVTFLADSAASGQAGILRWIGEQLRPERAKRRSLDDDRFRLQSYDPSAHASELVVPIAGLCRNGEADDHGDTLPCATLLSPVREIEGEIANPTADDSDVFAFTVDELRTVSLESKGGTDTFGTLYDRHGQRLERDDDGGEAGNFQIVKTLGPGLYFLRVEGGNRDEGSYRVAMEELDW